MIDNSSSNSQFIYGLIPLIENMYNNGSYETWSGKIRI